MDQMIKPSSISTSPGYFFGLILALEALFSFFDLSRIPGMMHMVEAIGVVIPVVANFLTNTAVKSNVAPYVALTCLLMPVKIFFTYLMILRLSSKDKALVICFPSSDATVIKKSVSFVLLFLLTVGMSWYVFFSYGDSSYFTSSDLPRSAIAKYRLVSASGIEMWFGWSVMHLTVMSFLLGLQLVFLIDWLRGVFNLKENRE